MLKKPNIPDERLIMVLREQYAIPVSRLEFLALGYDTSAGVYRVTAEDGIAYFLKVKEGEVYLPAVLVPRRPAQGELVDRSERAFVRGGLGSACVCTQRA